MRAVVRYIAAVMMTSGVLLIADAGATLAWQEPVSALIALREQGRLDDQFDRDSKVALRELALLPGDVRRKLRTYARRFERRLERGDAVGRIELPTLDRKYTMVEGTDTSTLRKGPAHYRGHPLPGQRGTFPVAGHRTTYSAPFHTIDKLDRGDEIVVRMPYGRFTYEVERTQIVKPTALWVTDRVRYDRIVLTACNPLYSAKERLVAFARLKRQELPEG